MFLFVMMHVGTVFGYNITHTKLIDYDRISYASVSVDHILKMVSAYVSYSYSSMQL